jgi:hypothetical protein
MTEHEHEHEDLTVGVGDCPHPDMWEGENTSNPDAQRCALCGTPRAQIEAERGSGDG